MDFIIIYQMLGHFEAVRYTACLIILAPVQKIKLKFTEFNSYFLEMLFAEGSTGTVLANFSLCVCNSLTVCFLHSSCFSLRQLPSTLISIQSYWLWGIRKPEGCQQVSGSPRAVNRYPETRVPIQTFAPRPVFVSWGLSYLPSCWLMGFRVPVHIWLRYSGCILLCFWQPYWLQHCMKLFFVSCHFYLASYNLLNVFLFQV